MAQQETNWDPTEIRRKRIVYLIFFFLIIIGSFVGSIADSEMAAQGVGTSFRILAYFTFAIIFVILLSRLARRTLSYSIPATVVLSLIIVFIPIVNLVTAAIIDWKIYSAIRKKESQSKTC